MERNKHRIARARDGRQFIATYLPSQSRYEKAAIRLFAQQAMAGRPPFDGPIDLRMGAFVPIPRSWSLKKQAAAVAAEIIPTSKPDCSNLVKLLEDAMIKVCYRDDSQISDLHVVRRYSERPRIVVELRRVVRDSTKTG